MAHHLDHAFDHLLAIHLELVLHVDLGRGEEGVNARMLRALDGFPCFVDVVLGGAGETADDGGFAAIRWISHLDGDAAYCFQIVGRSRRKSRFDDVHAELRQRTGHFHLLDGRHRRAG